MKRLILLFLLLCMLVVGCGKDKYLEFVEKVKGLQSSYDYITSYNYEERMMAANGGEEALKVNITWMRMNTSCNVCLDETEKLYDSMSQDEQEKAGQYLLNHISKEEMDFLIANYIDGDSFAEESLAKGFMFPSIVELYK